MFDWGVLKRGVPESVRFCIGDLPMYTFLIPTHPYRVPKALETEVQKELTKMLENGVISRTTSKWASPMVLVIKKRQNHKDMC